MPKIPHVSLRGKQYVFRLRVPKEIWGKFKYNDGYPKEVTKSLGTSDYKVAKKLGAHTLSHFQKLFDECEISLNKAKQASPVKDELSTFTDSQLMIPVLNWLLERSERDADYRDSVYLTKRQKDEFIDTLRIDKTHYKEAYEELDNSLGRSVAERCLAKENISYDKNSEAFEKLSRLFVEAMIEDAERQLLVLKDKPMPRYINPRFDPEQKTSPSLEKLITEFAAEKGENWEEHTHDSNRRSYNLIMDFFGPDIEIHKIERKKTREFKNLLNDIPKYLTRDFPRNKYSLQQAIKLSKREAIATKTKNNHIQNLEAIMNYAVSEGYLDRHYCSNLYFEDSESNKSKRKPFKKEYLQRIFSAPIFTGCKNPNHGYKIEGDVIPKDHGRFWVPLLALWTGMRAGECVQLEVKDIGKENNIDVIYIRESDDPNIDGDETAYRKRVKNASSVRFVPVPPVIKRIGFLNFVQHRKNDGETRLFPELKPTKTSNSASFTKWFNEGFLNEYVPERLPHKETFHSFRHNYRDAMKRAKIPKDVVCALGGWTTNMGSVDDYGGHEDPDVLYEHISNIDYPEIDLSNLYEE